MQPEKLIENQILVYLKSRKVFAWKIKSVGTYDERLGRFRKSSPLYRLGVSDILGIYRGIPIAIEVKSAKGQLSDVQRGFITEFVENGGRACVARSVDHVVKFLESVDEHVRILYTSK